MVRDVLYHSFISKDTEHQRSNTGTDKASIDLIFESTLVWQRRCVSRKKRQKRRRRRRLNFACFCIALIEISQRLYRNHYDEEDQDHRLFIGNVRSKNEKARYGEYLCRLLQDYLTNATSQWNMLSTGTGQILRSSPKMQRFKRNRGSFRTFRKERVVDPIVSDDEEEEEEEEIMRASNHHNDDDDHLSGQNSVQLKLENDRARLVDILKRTIHDNRLNAMRRCSIRAQRRLVRSAWSRWVLLTHRIQIATINHDNTNDDSKSLEKDVDALRMNVRDLQRRLREATTESWKWKRRFIEKGEV